MNTGKKNQKIITALERLAGKKGCIPGQLSIAWVVAQGAIPFPGTKNEGRFLEHWGAKEVVLSEDGLGELRRVIMDSPKGDR